MVLPDERDTVDAVYRAESRRVLATLIRLLGDFDLAEEALHDAFAAAVERWPQDGVPPNPRAWLVSGGRFQAVDGPRPGAPLRASLAPVPGPPARERGGPGPRARVGHEPRQLPPRFPLCHPA